MVTRITAIFRPFNGSDFRVNFYVPGAVSDPAAAAIQAVISAINAVTRAFLIELELTVINAITASATAGAAYVSEDKAQFNFSDVGGRPHNYKVPGLKAAILLPNKEGVDLGAAGVSGYISQILTHARGRGGADVTTLVSAHRTENRKRLKSAPQI